MPAPGYAAEIAALEAALALGEITVETDGDRVTYRSTADILKAKAHFERKAAEAANGSAIVSRSTIVAYERD